MYRNKAVLCSACDDEETIAAYQLNDFLHTKRVGLTWGIAGPLRLWHLLNRGRGTRGNAVVND